MEDVKQKKYRAPWYTSIRANQLINSRLVTIAFLWSRLPTLFTTDDIGDIMVNQMRCFSKPSNRGMYAIYLVNNGLAKPDGLVDRDVIGRRKIRYRKKCNRLFISAKTEALALSVPTVADLKELLRK